MWNDIVLTANEDLVLTALRFLEPKIERIAAVTSGGFYCYSGSRGGFKIKFRDSPHPVPIGSLGDGIWRMPALERFQFRRNHTNERALRLKSSTGSVKVGIALAIALIQSANGVLLIDEIDMGLHYTVMNDMWTLLFHGSQAFNVQIFATSHSYDCIQSLANVCMSRLDTPGNVTIQRLEAGKEMSVPFTGREIKIAAERHIEMR